MCQGDAPGAGRPRFGAVHWQRQRQAITRGLCQLCGKSLTASTKVSLAPQLLSCEPMLHRRCAAEAIPLCPHLQKFDWSAPDGIKQVLAYTTALMTFAHYPEDEVAALLGDDTGIDPSRIIGHAQIKITRWKSRSVEWLMAE
ncbi:MULTISPECIES: hypothetical protein [unclassified Mesorhizobium]|nr:MULTISPECIES: hypothetical protein [unclassified Mesorhizobium]TGT69532.1 hypothetical protein EN809_024740 [Mesorhizobium sp. M2E.F.Ca.ET.166.01.1.1]TGW01864.1 hypothetical protein EN797_016235 [Mesorhizobium sp. M2E.F.Ca.ET.154.01.1.1]